MPSTSQSSAGIATCSAVPMWLLAIFRDTAVANDASRTTVHKTIWSRERLRRYCSLIRQPNKRPVMPFPATRVKANRANTQTHHTLSNLVLGVNSRVKRLTNEGCGVNIIHQTAGGVKTIMKNKMSPCCHLQLSFLGRVWDAIDRLHVNIWLNYCGRFV